MSQDQIDILQEALASEKAARKQAEKNLADKIAELNEARQELEVVLNQENSQLQGVFEDIVDAYVIMSLDGDILKMNEAAVSLLGFNHAKENYNLIKMVASFEEARVFKSFKQLLKKGILTDFHLSIITRKKEQKLIHINASIIYDNDIPVGAQGILRDITIENKYKIELEAERQKYRRIIANMNLGLVEVGVDNKILMANQDFLNMSGYSEEDIIGKTGKELFQTKENTKVIELKDLKRHKGEAHSYEIKIKNKQGEDRYWLISGAPNYNLKEEVVGSIGVHLDITDIKQLESQKEKLLQELAKSNDELQEYAHIVSHDLKSPLRSIDALVNWIKEDNKGKLDAASLQNFKLIEKTLEKMEQLISDILTYSSVGSKSLEAECVDLNIILKELQDILFIPNHISVNILSELPKLKGDKVKFKQLFQNLISNAVKFSDKEKGIIEINVEEEQSFYQFSVKDNGVGIEKKHHDKIFKIFHSLNKNNESSGIGLSIVKKIIDLYKGVIWIESDLGKGTTFYFTIKK